MDYNKLMELRKKVSERIEILTKNNDFELSIRYLTHIHEELFKGIYHGNGSLRKYNLNKDEDILNGESVDYPDYNTVPSFLKFAFYDEKQINYKNLSTDEAAIKIAQFAHTIWNIHPFIEGNTRTTCVFIENYLNSLGYKVNNEIFKQNAEYFRNALVRASYKNEKLKIKKDIMPLERFFINVLNNQEVVEEDLYVYELFNKNKGRKRIK